MCVLNLWRTRQSTVIPTSLEASVLLVVVHWHFFDVYFPYWVGHILNAIRLVHSKCDEKYLV